MGELDSMQSDLYHPIEQICAGGMADITLCVKNGPRGFRKKYILKRISKELMESEEVRLLFLNEMRIHSLLYHANIVQLFDFNENDSSFILVLEYVPGWSLREIINQSRRSLIPIPTTWSLRILCDIAEALTYLHELKDEKGNDFKLVHRDLSPENILITPAGTAKICDFGLSKGATQSVATQVGFFRGKLNYISPEQAKGDLVDFNTDLFAATLCLAELILSPSRTLSDVLPSPKKHQQIMRALKEQVPSLPPALSTLLKTGFKVKPRNRFAHSREFRRMCQAVYREALIERPQEDFSGFTDTLFAAPSAKSHSRSPKNLEKTAGAQHYFAKLLDIFS